MKNIIAVIVIAALTGCGCSGNSRPERTEAKRIYFGFDDHSEHKKPRLKISLADTWSKNVCSHWQATVNEEDADYKLLFGTSTVTVLGRKGELLYTGGQGVLYAPHGNPDGSGVNICKLTGE